MNNINHNKKKIKRIKKGNYLIKYISFDFISVLLVQFIYFTHQPYELHTIFFKQVIGNIAFTKFLTLTIMVSYWMLIFYLSGYYSDLTRKSIIQHFTQSITTILLGSILLFFILVNKNHLFIRVDIIKPFLSYFIYLFWPVYILRLIHSWRYFYQIKNKKIGFRTLIIGSDQKSLHIFNELKNNPAHNENNIIGFVSIEENIVHSLNKQLPYLGHFTELTKIIQDADLDEAIIAIDPSMNHHIGDIINILKQAEIYTKLTTDLNTILEGAVKMSNVAGIPFVIIKNDLMPVWQKVAKLFLDYLFALLFVVILIPAYTTIAISIKLTSKGPIIYKQKRIGKHKKPFYIYKFRSMYIDAEKDGPALSRINDPRITPLGRFLRKWHIDEIPQFINVLKGDMSFVGPRPERKFYIDKIIQESPHYALLFQVKPGITSWGMVKFGYAQNTEQMIQRLQFDILYIENMSLLIDFRIILHTLKTIFSGDGK